MQVRLYDKDTALADHENAAPVVSVIIPTYKRPKMLAEAIGSVLRQTFTDYEIVVISNGENTDDRERSKLAALAPRCVYIGIDEANRSLARNRGIEAARGEWIAFLDDDDLWLPDKLERQLAFASSTNVSVIFSGFVLRMIGGHEHTFEAVPPVGMSIAEGMMLSNYGFGGGSCALIRRDALTRLGGFDIRMPCAEDWDMWIRLSQANRVGFVADAVSVVRRHKGSRGNTWNAHLFCAYWDLRCQAKAIRKAPPEMNHLIPRMVLAMARRMVAIKPPPVA